MASPPVIYQRDHEDPRIRDVIERIYADRGIWVSVAAKKKFLHKFGENPAATTAECTIMELQGSETQETYATGNTINRIVTDDTNFTGAVYMEGQTIADGDLTFVTQTKACNGFTAQTLDTPLYRLTRMQILGSTNLAAGKKIYGFENVATTDGVPNTEANTKCIVSAAEGTSLKASTSFSAVDYFIITGVYAAINKKTQGGGVVRLKIRESGGVFRTKCKIGINSLGSDMLWPPPQAPFEYAPANSDLILTSELDATAAVAGGVVGYLASIIG